MGAADGSRSSRTRRWRRSTPVQGASTRRSRTGPRGRSIHRGGQRTDAHSRGGNGTSGRFRHSGSRTPLGGIRREGRAPCGLRHRDVVRSIPPVRPERLFFGDTKQRVVEGGVVKGAGLQEGREGHTSSGRRWRSVGGLVQAELFCLSGHLDQCLAAFTALRLLVVDEVLQTHEAMASGSSIGISPRSSMRTRVGRAMPRKSAASWVAGQGLGDLAEHVVHRLTAHGYLERTERTGGRAPWPTPTAGPGSAHRASTAQR